MLNNPSRRRPRPGVKHRSRWPHTSVTGLVNRGRRVATSVRSVLATWRRTFPILRLLRKLVETKLAISTSSGDTISTGDNWFYKARDGYSPAVGLGTIDVFNLSKVIR